MYSWTRRTTTPPHEGTYRPASSSRMPRSPVRNLGDGPESSASTSWSSSDGATCVAMKCGNRSGSTRVAAWWSATANVAPWSDGEMPRPRKYICPASHAAAMASRARLSRSSARFSSCWSRSLRAGFSESRRGLYFLTMARERWSSRAHSPTASLSPHSQTRRSWSAASPLLFTHVLSVRSSTGQVAEVDADGGGVARVEEAHVVGAAAVGEPPCPGERPALVAAGGRGWRAGT